MIYVYPSTPGNVILQSCSAAGEENRRICFALDLLWPSAELAQVIERAGEG